MVMTSACARLCLAGAPAAEPPNAVSASTPTSAAASDNLTPLKLIDPSSFDPLRTRLCVLGVRIPNGRSDYWNSLAFSPDETMDVGAKLGELRKLLRGDLVARHGQVDLDDLLHLGRRVREHDDSVGEV